MAAPARRMNEARRWTAFVLLTSAMLLHYGGLCQDMSTALAPTNTAIDTSSTEPVDPNPSTDVLGSSSQPVEILTTTAAPTFSASPEPQVDTSLPTTRTDDSAYTLGNVDSTSTTSGGYVSNSDIVTGSTTMETSMETTQTSDEPQHTGTNLQSTPGAVFRCVKELATDKNAVLVTLIETSTCDETKDFLNEAARHMCDNCNIELFQEDSKLFLTGDAVEADVHAMAGKFKSENIKEKLGVVKVEPLWAKQSPTVLVTLLLIGLLLAAALILGYCLKNYRSRSAKGMRLAEEPYQVDEENQGNTLVSVAPLNPPEPQEKPNINGESPDGVKNQQPPVNAGGATTNGHSAAKTPVADTQL